MTEAFFFINIDSTQKDCFLPLDSSKNNEQVQKRHISGGMAQLVVPSVHSLTLM